jgi:NitT/TauT family transport system ATP-binding protein/nitrate/nitrite transport system substrate-binding protein
MHDDPPVRLGLVPLTDAAPLVVALTRGLFAQQGAAVEVATEPSWANIADKLAYGLLDGAIMLPPLALAMTLGLRRPAVPLLVPLSISRNGNAIVLATEHGEALRPGPDDPLAIGRRLRALLPRNKLRLAVVHNWSTHDLLLRYWLAASGIDPDRDIELSVVPPPQMPDALAAGRIDGFCAGAPWPAVAVATGAGRTILRSSAIWPGHPEKCLAVRADFAASRPDALLAVMRALLRAGAICDDPAEAAAIAAKLAEPGWFGLPARLIAGSLPGGSDPNLDRFTFAASGGMQPLPAHAAWFIAQMARWATLPDDAEARAQACYRPDLFRLAQEPGTRLGMRQLH